MAERAIFFIDGNNWYHGCTRIGVPDLFELSYAGIAKKLCGPREWIGTRYYVGAVDHTHPEQAAQRRFLAAIEAEDPRVTTHLGRVEKRPSENLLADEIERYVRNKGGYLEGWIRSDLLTMAARHKSVVTYREKAADVFLAIDLCRFAIEDGFDAAYLLSADGDFTPAVELARSRSKKVFAVSPLQSGALAKVVNSYIRIGPEWFDGSCYRPRK